MTSPSVDALMVAEARLNRSLIACVVVWLVGIGLAMSGLLVERSPSLVLLVLVAHFVLLLSCYVWFAVAAGKAATLLGEAASKYVLWILAAPVLAQVPIPIVSTLIGVSPLSIKFLLGGQLKRAIRERPLVE